MGKETKERVTQLEEDAKRDAARPAMYTPQYALRWRKRRLFAPQSPTTELKADAHATAVQTPEKQLHAPVHVPILGSTATLVFGAVLLVLFMAFALTLFGRRFRSRQDKTRLSYIL